MLKRPEGATIPQICEVTGWQAHTVRGTFAGALKKKLGLIVVSEKLYGSDRTYRIQSDTWLQTVACSPPGGLHSTQTLFGKGRN